jgi:hypothetical protein
VYAIFLNYIFERACYNVTSDPCFHVPNSQKTKVGVRARKRHAAAGQEVQERQEYGLKTEYSILTSKDWMKIEIELKFPLETLFPQLGKIVGVFVHKVVEPMYLDFDYLFNNNLLRTSFH